MELNETGLPGCYEILCKVLKDNRGSFTKTFHALEFEDLGLRTDWREEYYSISALGVIRGMHFQTPPMEHAKLVYCLAGEILDVVLDLRKGSSTYGEHRAITLTAKRGNGVYVPPGFAHGFLSLRDDSIVQYKVTSVYSRDHDTGIFWDSFGFYWPISTPIVSERDSRHIGFDEYNSPFVFQAVKE